MWKTHENVIRILLQQRKHINYFQNVANILQTSHTHKAGILKTAYSRKKIGTHYGVTRKAVPCHEDVWGFGDKSRRISNLYGGSLSRSSRLKTGKKVLGTHC
jgi:hypothetical protein